jgi:hypothetical protein
MVEGQTEVVLANRTYGGPLYYEISNKMQTPWKKRIRMAKEETEISWRQQAS